MRAGETEKSKTVNIKEINEIIKRTVNHLNLRGPVDIDVIEDNGQYYILEINPRFGGGYPHAYECGVNFPRMIALNAAGRVNDEADVSCNGAVVLKYSDVFVIE